MAVVAVACRLVSLGKEVVVAGVFGAGVATDAYALAVLIPSMGMSVLVLAVRSAFLTQYPRLRAEQPDRAPILVRQFLTGLLLATSLVVGVASLLLPEVWATIVAGDDPALLAASRELVLPAVWALLPIAAVGGLTAVLNARGAFAMPQATAVIPTLTVLLLLAYFGRRYGVWTLIVGLGVGSGVQTLVLAALVVRSRQSLWPSLAVSDVAVRRLALTAAPIILLGLFAQLNVYVDRTMASLLPSGSVAVLAWAALVYDLLTGTMLGSLLWVLLPHFSEQAASGDLPGLRTSLNKVTRAAAVVLWPLAGGMAVVAPSLLGQLQFGQLDQEACGEIGLALAAYGAGLFATLSGTATYQTMLALGRYRALLAVALLAGVFPNVVCNWALLPLGPAGLALATSIVAQLTLWANRHLVDRHLGRRGAGLTRRIVGCSFVAALAIAATWYVTIVLFQAIWPAAVWAGWMGLFVGGPMAAIGYGLALRWHPGGVSTRRMLRVLVGRLRRRTTTTAS